MKVKITLKYLAEIPGVILVLVILIPIGALYFLYKILTVPFSYICHKKSLYQKISPAVIQFGVIRITMRRCIPSSKRAG